MEIGGRTMAEAFGLVKTESAVIKEVSLIPLLVSEFESLVHHESSSELCFSISSIDTAYARLLVRSIFSRTSSVLIYLLFFVSTQASTLTSIERASSADAKRCVFLLRVHSIPYSAVALHI